MNGKKIILYVQIGLQIGVLLFFGYRLQAEYRELEYRESNKATLEQKKSDLIHEIAQHRDFVDRLTRDPDFQDTVVRRELGYAKEGETVYRFPKSQEPVPQTP
jgi:cell division protein FtsB